MSVFFTRDNRDVQYARDDWVPARAILKSWLSVGPAPKRKASRCRAEDRGRCSTSGPTGRIVPSFLPETERVRSASRDRTGSANPRRRLYADPVAGRIRRRGLRGGLSRRPLLLSHAFLATPRRLSDHVSIVPDGNLPLDAGGVRRHRRVHPGGQSSGPGSAPARATLRRLPGAARRAAVSGGCWIASICL